MNTYTPHHRRKAETGQTVWFDRKEPGLHQYQYQVPVVIKVVRRCASFVRTFGRKLHYLRKKSARILYEAFMERRFLNELRQLTGIPFPPPKPGQCIAFARQVVSLAKRVHAHA